MLTFYSHPLSGNARRVWIALLEKQIPFELVELKLDGDQYAPDFTEVNPLERVPVIMDDGFRVVESLAILDYLEAKYPTPALMPTEAEAIAKVRMVETVIVCDLQPALTPLMQQAMQLPVSEKKVAAARDRVATVVGFFEHHLLEANPYCVGESFSLADIVAGTLLPALPMFDLSLDPYPKTQGWLAQLGDRPTWQQTAPTPELMNSAREMVRGVMERRGEL